MNSIGFGEGGEVFSTANRGGGENWSEDFRHGCDES